MIRTLLFLGVVVSDATAYTSITKSYRKQPTSLCSTPNINDDNIVIDHATISPEDMWEDHYFASQSVILNSEEEEQTYQRATHSYVSSVLRDMSEDDRSKFLTDISTKSINETPLTKDSYVDEP